MAQLQIIEGMKLDKKCGDKNNGRRLVGRSAYILIDRSVFL